MKTLNYEERDELDDKYLTSVDFIKEDAMSMAMLWNKDTSHTGRVGMFNLLANIDTQLEEMWEAFNGYRLAYDALLEEYEKLTAQSEES